MANDIATGMKFYYASAILGVIAAVQPSGKNDTRLIEDMAMATEAAKWILGQVSEEARMEDLA